MNKPALNNYLKFGDVKDGLLPINAEITYFGKMRNGLEYYIPVIDMYFQVKTSEQADTTAKAMFKYYIQLFLLEDFDKKANSIRGFISRLRQLRWSIPYLLRDEKTSLNDLKELNELKYITLLYLQSNHKQDTTTWEIMETIIIDDKIDIVAMQNWKRL